MVFNVVLWAVALMLCTPVLPIVSVPAITSLTAVPIAAVTPSPGRFVAVMPIPRAPSSPVLVSPTILLFGRI